MILTIDIGNTNIVMGCFHKDQLLFLERFSTEQDSTSLEYATIIREMLDLHEITPAQIRGGIISYVPQGGGASMNPLLKVGFQVGEPLMEHRGYSKKAAEKDSVYGQLHFQPVIETDGDCYARARVRLREVLRSVEIIEGCIDNIPDGPIDVKVRGVPPKKECFVRVEQPRGEALYYVKGNGTKFLERFRLRTPTNANLPALVKMLQGCDLADVPNIILTIDPCISCCER